MKKLNNKGYMLVEIIVAFSLAIAIMYLITDATIKAKNRNDDLMVRMLTAADQAIIYNMVMSDVYAGNTFNCSNVSINGKKFTYNKDKVNIVNDYVNTLYCSQDYNTITIKVKQLPDENFNVVIPN